MNELCKPTPLVDRVWAKDQHPTAQAVELAVLGNRLERALREIERMSRIRDAGEACRQIQAHCDHVLRVQS